MVYSISITLSKLSKGLIQPLINKRGFSAWVDEQIRKELTSSRMIEDEITKHKREIYQLNEQLVIIQEHEKELVEARRKSLEVMPQEVDFWRNAVRILTRDINFLDGQKAFYQNTFNKSVSRSDFIKQYQHWKTKLLEELVKEEEKVKELLTPAPAPRPVKEEKPIKEESKDTDYSKWK